MELCLEKESTKIISLGTLARNFFLDKATIHAVHAIRT